MSKRAIVSIGAEFFSILLGDAGVDKGSRERMLDPAPLKLLNRWAVIHLKREGTVMSDVATESNVILDLEREWFKKLKEKNSDWIVNLFAADGRQFPPGAEPVVGPKALHAAWEAMAHTEGFEVSWEPTEAHVSASGDMAYDFGAATIRTPDGRAEAAKYLVVWVRRGGEWKVAVDMFNTNSPSGK
jgi:ketosteroid isomerase-like protein